MSNVGMGDERLAPAFQHFIENLVLDEAVSKALQRAELHVEPYWDAEIGTWRVAPRLESRPASACAPGRRGSFRSAAFEAGRLAATRAVQGAAAAAASSRDVGRKTEKQEHLPHVSPRTRYHASAEPVVRDVDALFIGGAELVLRCAQVRVAPGPEDLLEPVPIVVAW